MTWHRSKQNLMHFRRYCKKSEQKFTSKQHRICKTARTTEAVNRQVHKQEQVHRCLQAADLKVQSSEGPGEEKVVDSEDYKVK